MLCFVKKYTGNRGVQHHLSPQDQLSYRLFENLRRCFLNSKIEYLQGLIRYLYNLYMALLKRNIYLGYCASWLEALGNLVSSSLTAATMNGGFIAC